MSKLNVEVTYLFNSGYSIETENHLLIIDYYKGNLELGHKPTTFFVTHAHEDHYNKKIFKYKDRASYVLSYDISGPRPSRKLMFIQPGQEKSFGDMTVRAFDSTDEGSSFLIQLDGLNIFHSGDLNWWAWEDQGPIREEERRREYCSEIDKLAELGLNIDLAFVPLDPRLEHNYHLAGQYFIKTIGPSYFFPMHFGDKFQTTHDFLHKMKDSSTEICTVDKRGQVYRL